MSTPLEQVDVDFLLLADRAEVLNGKLYMMGGAWDRRHIRDIGAPLPLTIVVGVLVPWNLTNEPHRLHIRIEDEDGSPVPPEVEATVNVGRPVNATQGQSFRATAVINNRWTVPRYGVYRVVASVAGHSEKRVAFYAVEAG
jgi:hypothetical protein